MKTIVFHSYKGGVGRTLTLANLGYALSRMGKKVVLLDLDVDAPSLPTKFQRELNVQGGYIDYIKEYFEPVEDKVKAKTVIYEFIEANTDERSDSLAKYTISINDNLKIIPAGDPSQAVYWFNLGSNWLHFLLSLTREEINQIENGLPIRDTVSRKYLQKELQVIQGLFGGRGADFLIVDCRSPREYSSVALIFWADIVVSMFNASSDGLEGLVNICRFVRRGRPREIGVSPILRPRIIPVLCRVPDSFSEESARRLNEQIAAIWNEAQGSSDRQLTPPEPFATLHEFRDLEQSERLLLHRGPVRKNSARRAIRDVEALLSHDYVQLFSNIFAHEDDVAHGAPLREVRIWREILGLTDAIVRERNFPMRRNVMLNEDDEPNVALRTKTISGWFASLKKGITTALKDSDRTDREIELEIQKLFQQTGYDWGSGFGSQFLQQRMRVSRSNSTNVPALLDAWCKFDHEVGFGVMTCSYDPSTERGRIVWKESFLGNGGRFQPHVGEFACGYIRGVLESLLPHAKGRLSVRATGLTTFTFAKRSHRRKRSVELQSKQ